MYSSSRKTLSRFLTAVIAAVGLVALGSASAKAEGQISVKWIAHAAFEVTSPGGTTLLIDPFIAKNPKTPAELKDLSQYKPDAILISHSHFDHAADVVEIAKLSKAKVIGVFDHLNSMEGLPKEQMLGGNPGGKFKIGDVTVHLVPAVHSSTPGGRPLGFVVAFADGRTLYHTGDTHIFGDMSLIQEIRKPEIILLQAGGGPYNQDPETAKLAIDKYFDPKVIIPMHYGTFPVLADEAAVKAAFAGDSRLKMMQPGQTLKF